MRLEERKSAVEGFLNGCFVCEPSAKDKIIYEAARYSLTNGGKRLRGCLLLAFCEAVGGDLELALPFSGAIEMIHAYSLVHDDLPCMDNDDMRRGMPTNHRVFGEAVALLAGDALLNGAYEIALEQCVLQGERAVFATKTIANAAGIDGMIGGQTLDIDTVWGRDAEYLTATSRKKTGALFEAACVCGVILGGGSENQLLAAREYAKNLGLAFQIWDDYLGAVGDADTLGKTVGIDKTNDKITFFDVLGADGCVKEVEKLTNLAVSALDVFENSRELCEIAKSLLGRNK